MPKSQTSDNLRAIVTESGVRRATKGKAISSAVLAGMLMVLMSWLAYLAALPLVHWQEWVCFGLAEAGGLLMAWMLYSILLEV